MHLLIARRVLDLPHADQPEQGLLLRLGNWVGRLLPEHDDGWAGDFVNSYVLAKMKIWTSGRWLWTRTVGSTIAGEGVDSIVFYPAAFAGLWTTHTLTSVILFNWVAKVAVEVALTPFTYWVVGKLKRIEGIDYYDRDTNFTPFSLATPD